MHKITLFISTLLTAITVAGLAIAPAPLWAQSDTAFTYQGELKQNGGLANGSYNLDFSLWNAASGGGQIGSPDSQNGVPIADGRFSVELDFGDSAFNNSNRWLEITVDGNELDPRTKITRSPYSIQTRGIFVDANENIGIGTSVPDDDLHIVRNQPGLMLQDDDDPQSYGLIEDTNASQLRIFKFTENGGAAVDVNPLSLDGFSSALVRFFRSTNTTGSKQVQFLRGNNSSSPSASIGVDGENSFFQLHGGNVGIGTATPALQLDVAGTVRATMFQIEHINDSSRIFGGSNSSLGIANFAAGDIRLGTNLNPGGATNRLIIKPDGKVGIGTQDPLCTLHVDGNACKPGGGSWANVSDIRLKKNIKPLDGALEKLLRLRGVTFEYIDPDSISELSGERTGVVAQEVEKVFPDWVDERTDGYKAVTFRGFEALTVEALRELREEKNKEINSLRSENETLRARLDALEKLVLTEKEPAK